MPLMLLFALVTTLAQEPAAPLKVDIKTTGTVFKYDQPIKVAVTLTNTSSAPVRIIKPGLDYKYSEDVVSFRIERADGVVADRKGSCIPSLPISSGESRSVLIAPGDHYDTTIDLWPDFSETGPPNPTDGVTMTACWSYYFGKDRNVSLKPGQYKITLKYAIPANGNPRGWSAELAGRIGDVWRGQVSSNVVAITIK